MPTISDEIKAIESEIGTCLDTNSPIDPLKIKRLCALRVEYMKELAGKHSKLIRERQYRMDLMQSKLRELTDLVSGVPESVYKLNPQGRETLLLEMDKLDTAAHNFVEYEQGEWSESQASGIEAGIRLILADITTP